MFLDLQLWVSGGWRQVARVEAIADEALGYRGKLALEYDSDYAASEFGQTGSRSLSSQF